MGQRKKRRGPLLVQPELDQDRSGISDMQRVMDTFAVGEELLWQPARLAQPGPWIGHIAIGFWLVKVLRPTMFVELGTHTGNSYSAFCQAIAELGLPARAFAVDTWKGDEHSGIYGEEVFADLQRFNDCQYANFSTLLRTTFDDARSHFGVSSIDLLHIDGMHSYETVRHDFDYWRDALSERGVVVFHDTNVREGDFGVWKAWQELTAQYPSFEFFHSNGLGILGVGAEQPPALRQLFETDRHSANAALVRRMFSARGDTFRWRVRVLDHRYRIEALTDEQQRLSEAFERSRAAIGELQETIGTRDAALQENIQELLRLREQLREREEMILTRDQELLRMQEQLRRLDEAIKLKEAEARRQEEGTVEHQATLARQSEAEIGRLTTALASLQQKSERRIE
jgi:O-antigen biosynthesis protein